MWSCGHVVMVWTWPARLAQHDSAVRSGHPSWCILSYPGCLWCILVARSGYPGVSWLASVQSIQCPVSNVQYPMSSHQSAPAHQGEHQCGALAALDVACLSFDVLEHWNAWKHWKHWNAWNAGQPTSSADPQGKQRAPHRHMPIGCPGCPGWCGCHAPYIVPGLSSTSGATNESRVSTVRASDGASCSACRCSELRCHTRNCGACPGSFDVCSMI